jgi:hypothetical protein
VQVECVSLCGKMQGRRPGTAGWVSDRVTVLVSLWQQSGPSREIEIEVAGQAFAEGLPRGRWSADGRLQSRPSNCGPGVQASSSGIVARHSRVGPSIDRQPPGSLGRDANRCIGQAGLRPRVPNEPGGVSTHIFFAEKRATGRF